MAWVCSMHDGMGWQHARWHGLQHAAWYGLQHARLHGLQHARWYGLQHARWHGCAAYTMVQQSLCFFRKIEDIGICDVAVVQPHDSDEPIAIVCPESISAVAVRAKLLEEMDAHLVPRHITSTSRICFDDDGLVDYSSFINRSHLDRRDVPTTIQRCVSDVLGLNAPVLDHEDFFELGGTSLLLGRLAAQLRQRLTIY